MAFLDPMDLRFDDDDDPSTAMGTETLAANDLIPEEFAEGSQLPKQRIGGREFLIVEQSASLRSTCSRYPTRLTAMPRPQFVISEKNTN
jgi:hypothetical protein